LINKKIKKMDKKTATQLIIQSIKTQKVKFQELADAIGSSLIFTIHALHGQATLDKTAAEKIGEILSLSPELVESLQEIPLRSVLQATPSDPTLYRLTEMMQNYAAGQVVVFGPVLDPAGAYGLGIVNAVNEAHVQELIKADPANGLNRYEFYRMLAIVPFA
jgi:cyanate lyase